MADCIKPKIPSGGTGQEWADYFVLFGDYLICLATKNSEDGIGSHNQAFQEFLAAAEEHKESIP